jgi:hypothetical protein
MCLTQPGCTAFVFNNITGICTMGKIAASSYGPFDSSILASLGNSLVVHAMVTIANIVGTHQSIVFVFVVPD